MRGREGWGQAPVLPGVRRCNRQGVEMLGRLTWAAIPFDQPLPLYAMGVVGIGILAVLGLVMLLRGFSDAIMMRSQQAIAVGDAQGYLPPDHYDQIFSAHGSIMIFFV